MLKTTTKRKKLKAMGHIALAHSTWTNIPGMVRWKILIPRSDMSC